jgi:hypothetical protein
MRIFWIIVLCFSITVSLFSQEDEDSLLIDEDTKTLLSDDISISGFGSPFLSYTELCNQKAYIAGGGGALLFAGKFYIGGYGSGMMNDFVAMKGEYKDTKLEFGHSGLWLGYFFLCDKLISPEVSVMAGWGSMSVKNLSGYINPDKYDGFSVFIPSAQINVRILQYFKIGAGASYRKVSGLSFSDYNGEEFSGPEIFMSLKIGLF